MTDMTDPGKTAPEIKAAPEITAAFDDFMEAFEAFKETNDTRLGEIEQKLTSDVVTRDKMDRINRAMDEQKKLLDQLVLKKARPPLGRSAASGTRPPNTRPPSSSISAAATRPACATSRPRRFIGLGTARWRLSRARRDRHRDRPPPFGGLADPLDRHRPPGLRRTC
jgi:predicted phage gp36 major capsid-like protein